MKNKEFLFNALKEIDYFTEKLGETFYDFVQKDDNFTYDMAEYIMHVFEDCKTDREFEIANNMLVAICGYNINSIIETIKARDKANHCWESL